MGSDRPKQYLSLNGRPVLWHVLSQFEASPEVTDIVLVALMLGESQAGVYTAAYRVCFLIMAIANSLHWTYLPRLARVPLDDLKSMSQMIVRAAKSASSLGPVPSAACDQTRFSSPKVSPLNRSIRSEGSRTTFSRSSWRSRSWGTAVDGTKSGLSDCELLDTIA